MPSCYRSTPTGLPVLPVRSRRRIAAALIAKPPALVTRVYSRSRSAVRGVPGSFELFRKIIVRPAGPLAMRLEQLDDLLSLFRILHVVPCREDALRRDDDGASLDRATRNAADNLHG
jgi:hypothetical protein